jgi:hypothetical protein
MVPEWQRRARFLHEPEPTCSKFPFVELFTGSYAPMSWPKATGHYALE